MNHVVLVDSRDRDFTQYPTPNTYRIRLPKTLYNVVGARLVSAEIPRSYHTFSTTAHNVSFTVTIGTTVSTITIEDGNYTFLSLVTALEKALEIATGLDWTVMVSSTTNKLTMLNSATTQFTLDTVQSPVYDKQTDWGLLFYLGFPKGPSVSDANGTITSPSPATFHGMSYILLDIDELRGADEGGLYGSEIGGRPLAKLVLDPGKMGIAIIEKNECLEVSNPQLPRIPRLRELHIKFRFHDGRLVDFQGVDHSFVLVVETAVHTPTSVLHTVHVPRKKRRKQQPPTKPPVIVTPPPTQQLSYKPYVMAAIAACLIGWFVYARGAPRAA